MGSSKGNKPVKKAIKKNNTKKAFIENNKNNKWKSKSNQKKKEKKLNSMEDEDIEVEKVISMRNNDESFQYNSENLKSKNKFKLVKEHQDELEGLKDADPEFYKYLQENDASLLQFGEDEDDEDNDIDYYEDDLDNLSETNEEDNANLNNKKKSKNKKTKVSQVEPESKEISEDQIKQLVSRLVVKGGSINALKRLLTIFRSACIPLQSTKNEPEDEYNMSSSGNYVIDTPEIYELIMTTTIEYSYQAIYKILECKELKTVDDVSNLVKHNKWKQIELLVLSYMKSILHTLQGLLESVNQGQVAVLVISSLEKYIPFLGSLPRLSKALLKILLGFWSRDIPLVEDIHNVKGHAFLRIRQMAMQLPGTFLEESFRLTYLTFARNSKSFNETSSSSNVVFMSQCIVELYSIDITMAYQQSFLFIRQLALHLRLTILKTSSTTIRQVTNWQYLNCVRLWTRVLCAMPESNQLGSLIFPLTQIILGIISIINSLYYVPLKYHLITCIHQLISHSYVYIPILTKIIDILDNSDYFTSKSTPSTDTPPNFIYLTKLPNNTISTTIVKDAIVLQTISLIRQHIEIFRYHVALPEYCYILIKKLKKFISIVKFNKWKNLFKVLLNQIELYCSYVKSNRNQILANENPSHITEFEKLLPAGSPLAKTRLNQLLTLSNLSNPLSTIMMNQSNTQTVDTNTDEIEEVDEDNKDEIVDKKMKKKKGNKLNKKKNVNADTLNDNVVPLDWSDEDD